MMQNASLLACVLLAGCNGTAIFRANFDSENVGTTPASLPPGDPPDDEISISGDTAAVTIVKSVELDSLAMRIERDQLEVAVDCIPAGSPHTSGRFLVAFRGLSEHQNPTGVTVAVLGKGDVPRAAFALLDGQIVVQGSGPFPIGYQALQEHAVLLAIDLDAGTYSLGIGDGTDFESLESLPLLSGTGFQSLRFSFPPQIVEGFPGAYVVDDIIVSEGEG